jgi:NAD(P)-dependent dehydrogenase (short-subunit alcohol dehydrogenase family)
MDLGIAGLRVLVTAGASGIGAAIARAFLAEGARVHVCDIDGAALAAFTDATGAGGALCDVSDRAAVGAMFDAAQADLGGLDCLVNNAGIAGPTAAVDEADPEEWDRCVSICLNSQFYCTRLAVAPLRGSANPSIVNLSSAAGKFGFRNRSAYAAAKWGVIGFTKSIARELGPDGIRCNAILPGIVEGPRIDRVIAAKAASLNRTDDEVRDELLALTSMGEMIAPERLADTILFLASPRGRQISGQAISVDADLQGLV